MVGGPNLRVARASEAFVELADSCGYALAHNAIRKRPGTRTPPTPLPSGPTGEPSALHTAQRLSNQTTLHIRGPHFQQLKLGGLLPPPQEGEGHHRAARSCGDRENGPMLGCVDYDPLRAEDDHLLNQQWGRYTTELEIHNRPYNVIKNWNYMGLVDATHNGKGNCWTMKVRCEEELSEAIEIATGEQKDCLCFIEEIVHRDDTGKELLEWGVQGSLLLIATHQILSEILF
ncbi:pyruvate decarboxylase-3 [Actinidia rufa]|uniref:Pyruvate decarboxylase-3 n=1 Tax=Actinidia rufa TaxID=165716 RepID=A0A7J0FKW3_9ERIC|nr:pyruvate decarboxylase-3 [Actinidia rufa]